MTTKSSSGRDTLVDIQNDERKENKAAFAFHISFFLPVQILKILFEKYSLLGARCAAASKAPA
jgi:hypothetical protein